MALLGCFTPRVAGHKRPGRCVAQRHGTCEVPVAGQESVAGSHVVQFYGEDQELVASVTSYLVAGAASGGTAVVIATPDHRHAFAHALTAAGLDVETAQAAGNLVLLDAADTLDAFMFDGKVDADAFNATIGGLVRDVAATGPVSAYGEMVAILWERGLVNAAIDLETMWNDLGEAVPFSLFCAYPLASVGDAEQLAQLHAVCHLHTDVLGGVDDRGHGVASGHFDGPAGVTGARHFVLRTLEQAGFHDIADNVAIVVTELTTNAVLHAQSAFTVTVLIEGDTVRVAVRDRSAVFPQPREAMPTALGGRGLGLVGAVARWGVEAVAGGKTVWAELHA